MDPKDFSWTEDQSVTVTNPTANPYKFMVHSKEYQLGAGQTAKMPGYIAWLYVYGLATQLAQADGKWSRWNEEEFRQEYYQKLIAGVAPLVETIEVEPEPEVELLEDDLPEGGESYEPTLRPEPKVVRRGRPARA